MYTHIKNLLTDRQPAVTDFYFPIDIILSECALPVDPKIPFQWNRLLQQAFASYHSLAQRGIGQNYNNMKEFTSNLVGVFQRNPYYTEEDFIRYYLTPFKGIPNNFVDTVTLVEQFHKEYLSLTVYYNTIAYYCFVKFSKVKS